MRRYIEPDRLTAASASSARKNHRCQERFARAFRRGQRRWAALIASGSIARIGTQCTASYRWSDGRSLTAGHLYLTQTLRPDVGLNIYIRQPVPGFPGLRGRLEATADLRNLLAEGYLPLATTRGGQVLLLHTPRSVRGGFAFVF